MILKADGLQVSLRDRGKEGWLGDRAAFAQVFLAGEYDYLLSRIRPGDTVLDAGANIGCFTLRASRRAGAHGLVIAVEPEGANAASLEANIRRNGLANVTVIRKALGAASNKTVAIFGTGTTASDKMEGRDVVDPTAGTSRTVVKTVTVDELAGEVAVSRLDIIKVDIEGAEKPVFSTDATSAKLSTARALAVEVHDADGVELVRNRLRRTGFHAITPVKSESAFLSNSIRGVIRRPDLALRLYGVDVAKIFTRMVGGPAAGSEAQRDNVLGLIYASQ